MPLDRASPEPLQRQIYRGLRAMILAGRLPSGSRVPSTRLLASELAVSRATVFAAFEQLRSEGYIEGRAGSSTRVATRIPDDVLALRPAVGIARACVLARADVHSARGLGAPGARGARSAAFRLGLPALDAFPLTLWAQLTARRWRRPSASLLAGGDARGYRPLREAIASHLATSRGVRCSSEQVLVVGGSRQALDFAARLLLGAGDVAWVEEPGHASAREALLAAGARVVPVPVDAEGLDVSAGERAVPGPRVVYVSPSHQYPLGGAMSAPRRAALLSLARRDHAWVIEHDHDADFRYAGQPQPSLQGADEGARVLHVGTANRVLFPSLRLGYLVVPAELVDAFTAACVASGARGPTVEQAVFADFIADGHLARHIRRMRSLYMERQEALLAAARAELDGALELTWSDAGMHLVGRLAPGADDCAVARRAATRGVDVVPLSAFYAGAPPRGGLVLGYAGVRPPSIWRAARELAAACGESRAADS